MLRALALFWIVVFLAPAGLAWKLELHGAGEGAIFVEHTAGEWRLRAPGRRDRWVPRPCGQSVWGDFETELLRRVDRAPLRWPARADVPPRVEPVRVKWKDQEFFIPRDGELARWLRALPDELGVKRAEEQIYCRRGVK